MSDDDIICGYILFEARPHDIVNQADAVEHKGWLQKQGHVAGATVVYLHSTVYDSPDVQLLPEDCCIGRIYRLEHGGEDISLVTW